MRGSLDGPGRPRAARVCTPPCGVRCSPRGLHHRGIRAARGENVWKARPSCPASQRRSGTRKRGAVRRVASGEHCQPQAGSGSHDSSSSEKLYGAAFVAVIVVNRSGIREDAVEPGHRRHLNAVAAVGLVPPVARCVSLECSPEQESRRGRSVGVNAAATGASGPGIQASAAQMRPLFGEGPSPRKRRPPAGGREHLARSLMKRQGLTVVRPPFAGRQA